MPARMPPARRGRPPSAESRDTRALILDTALQLFARQGYAGTSVRQIARALKLSDSALYAHFESKQAILDTLLAQAGPTAVIDLLDAVENELATANPATFLRELVRRAMAIWDEPRVRQFIDVFIREGAYGSTVGRTDVAAAREAALRRLGAHFRRWMDAGLMKRDFSPEFLAWELFSPVAYIRLLYLHGQATEAERRAGHRVADAHVDYFISCVLHEPERRTRAKGRRKGASGQSPTDTARDT